jgi:hypothetical protein
MMAQGWAALAVLTLVPAWALETQLLPWTHSASCQFSVKEVTDGVVFSNHLGCLSASSIATEATVGLEPCLNTSLQVFKYHGLYLQLAAQPSLCVGTRASLLIPFAAVDLYRCEGKSNQQWQLVANSTQGILNNYGSNIGSD